MKILLVTDAWEPQMNGVVRTLTKTVAELRKMGHDVEVINPYDGYWTMQLPTYPDIRLAPFARWDVEKRLVQFAPEAIHIATEGPLGQAARAFCLKWGVPFTTSYHTKFPEYTKARFPFIPLSWPYKFVRDFHNSGGRIMVTTPSMAEFLKDRGFENLVAWTRGVDLEQFNPRFHNSPEDIYGDLPKPIFLNVGRIAVEKNMEAFLDLDLPGSKVVVGHGPAEEQLKKKYPDVHFMGAKFGDELARYFADADVFVFPSLTDTFGLVIIESMAAGTPVAAYPVNGPIDILPDTQGGYVDDDLKKACLDCLNLKRKDVRKTAEKYSWGASSKHFFSLLAPEYEPVARKRWRRIRRLGRIASSPFHVIRRNFRRAWRIIRGKSV